MKENTPKNIDTNNPSVIIIPSEIEVIRKEKQ